VTADHEAACVASAAFRLQLQLQLKVTMMTSNLKPLLAIKLYNEAGRGRRKDR